MPSAANVTACARCGAPIRWTVTAAGKAMAVNAAPDPDGNQAVYTDATGRVRSRAITAERPEPEAYEWQAMPHAATCKAPSPRRPAPRRAPYPVRRTAPWRPR